jgi:L-lactate utilization protein LutB
MHVCFLKREKNIKSIVQSKSETSEEIQLNPYLEEHGIPVSQTALRDWMTQLAEQTPPVWSCSAPMD